jgi:HEAT repeat protein
VSVKSEAPDHERLARVRQLEKSAEVAPLVDMLADPSWSVRREVVQALTLLGDAVVAPLCECLRTQRDDEARIAATVDTLVGCQSELVEPGLLPLARDTNAAVVADVAAILGRRRRVGGSQTLVDLTLHADDNVAVAAIEALGRLGGRAAVDALISCVQGERFFRVFPAIDVLGRSGDPRAVEPLAALLADSRYALEAARALGRTADRRAVAPLVGLLTSPSAAGVRVASLGLLELAERHGQLYGAAAVVHEAVSRLLTEQIVRRLGQSLPGADKAEKIAMCRLLGQSRSEAASEVLVQLLDANDAEVVATAGEALLGLGPASEHAVLSALERGDSTRRKTLLPSVSAIGSTSALAACLEDASADVRVLACEALGRIGAVACVPALFGLLDDNNQRVVHAAVAAIQSLGTTGTEPLALAAASSPSTSTRRAALRILAYFAYPSALALFASASLEAEPRMRDIALQGLALLEHPEALGHLLDAAHNPVAGVRAGAMRALGYALRTQMGVDCLLRGLTDDDPWARYYACQALGKLKVEEADEAIGSLLNDAAGQVRVGAIEALSHLGSAFAIDTLRGFAADSDVDLQRAALVGLGLRRDHASIPLLVKAAAGGDSATQLVALSALASLEGAEVVPALVQAALARSEGVRVAAINLLAERPGRAAADALVGLLLRDQEPELLLTALAAPLEGRVAALQAALNAVDDDHALQLTSCLSRLKTEAATRALYQTLSSENVAARKAAVSAIAALGTQEARSAIEQVVNIDSDADVRRSASLYLAT